MKRHVEEKELPYFAATLTAYLRESHPELLPDKHFIAERSDHAAQTSYGNTVSRFAPNAGIISGARA